VTFLPVRHESVANSIGVVGLDQRIAPKAFDLHDSPSSCRYSLTEGPNTRDVRAIHLF
jgi:hypothetical protein